MRHGIMISLMFLASHSFAQSLPASVHMTPIKKTALSRVDIAVPEKFKTAFTQNHTLNVPPGYTAQVYYAGRLNKPRFFAWGPDSVLFVANKTSGEIIALPDRNRDGIADTAIVAASGFHLSHDLAFYNGAMYVAEERRVVKCTDPDIQGVYRTKSVFIDNIMEGARQPGGGHDTRTIVFDPLKKKMYLSIGSSCNVCREEYRALIEEFNDDGSGRRPYATGIRNAVGMTLHNGLLWAVNNGSDWQGDDIPPEWFDVVRDGGFYGHPFAYAHGVYFDFNAHQEYHDLLPLTDEDSARVRSMVPPAALVQAHSAPMAIVFSNASFPEQFRYGAFVAYRGSWNRTLRTGYKIVFMKLRHDGDTTVQYVTDVVTGFQKDGGNSYADIWGRPVGLAVDQRGNLYVGSDDITQCILIVSPRSPKKK